MCCRKGFKNVNISNGLFFFERYILITATVCAYKLNNLRYLWDYIFRKRIVHCLNKKKATSLVKWTNDLFYAICESHMPEKLYYLGDKFEIECVHNENNVSKNMHTNWYTVGYIDKSTGTFT